MKTLILRTDELQKLIPETLILNERKFENLQDVLQNVVEAVESSGKWQFVQYMKDNPSLFIVREKKIETNEKKESTFTMAEVQEIIKQLQIKPREVKGKTTNSKKENIMPVVEGKDLVEAVENVKQKRFEPITLPNNDSKLFGENKLSWK